MVESGSKIMAASLLPELVRQKDTSALPTCLHDLPKAHMANVLSHEIPEILHVVGQSCLLARLARGAPACVSQACALKTTSLVFLLYVATPDHPQSTHAQQRKVCSFCAIHSLTALISTCSRLVEGAQPCSFSRNCVRHRACPSCTPREHIEAVALPSSQLLACQRSNKEKDKHEMLGKLLSCTCWDLKMYKPLAEIYKPLHGCCWLLQRLWAHREKQQHRRHTTQHTMSLVAIWDITLRFERTWPRCDLRPKRVVKWTTSLDTTTIFVWECSATSNAQVGIRCTRLDLELGVLLESRFCRIVAIWIWLFLLVMPHLSGWPGKFSSQICFWMLHLAAE